MRGLTNRREQRQVQVGVTSFCKKDIKEEDKEIWGVVISGLNILFVFAVEQGRVWIFNLE